MRSTPVRSAISRLFKGSVTRPKHSKQSSPRSSTSRSSSKMRQRRTRSHQVLARSRRKTRTRLPLRLHETLRLRLLESTSRPRRTSPSPALALALDLELLRPLLVQQKASHSLAPTVSIPSLTKRKQRPKPKRLKSNLDRSLPHQRTNLDLLPVAKTVRPCPSFGTSSDPRNPLRLLVQEATVPRTLPDVVHQNPRRPRTIRAVLRSGSLSRIDP